MRKRMKKVLSISYVPINGRFNGYVRVGATTSRVDRFVIKYVIKTKDNTNDDG